VATALSTICRHSILFSAGPHGIGPGPCARVKAVGGHRYTGGRPAPFPAKVVQSGTRTCARGGMEDRKTSRVWCRHRTKACRRPIHTFIAGDSPLADQATPFAVLKMGCRHEPTPCASKGFSGVSPGHTGNDATPEEPRNTQATVIRRNAVPASQSPPVRQRFQTALTPSSTSCRSSLILHPSCRVHCKIRQYPVRPGPLKP
jgi:hypothetical protein